MYYERELDLEEMPQGLVISYKKVNGRYINLVKELGYITIASPDDALAIIDSLKQMLLIQYPDIAKENNIS
jgi:hypothetical protein